MSEFLKRVARTYHEMPNTPDNPLALGAYDSLKREILAQFHILESFVDVAFTEADPYHSSADMFDDLANCRRLNVYTLADLPVSHPFAETLTLAGHGTLTYNSVFRAVHDGLAHFPERLSFGPRGEFKAFQAHCRILSYLSRWAIATETLGQNTWFNYGPYSHLPVKERPYAEQKTALLPLELVTEALAIDADRLLV